MTSDGFGDEKGGHFISMRDAIDSRVVERTAFQFKQEVRFWPHDDTVICDHCGRSIYGGHVRELGAEGKAYAHLVAVAVAVAGWLMRQGNKVEGPFREQDGVPILRMRDPLDPAIIRSVVTEGGTIHFDGASRITCSHCGSEIRGGYSHLR